MNNEDGPSYDEDDDLMPIALNGSRKSILSVILEHGIIMAVDEAFDCMMRALGALYIAFSHVH